MIDYEKLDVTYGVQKIPEYHQQIIVPKLTLKDKFLILASSFLELIKELGWITITMIGLCLQVGSLAYIAGIMFIKGAS